MRFLLQACVLMIGASVCAAEPLRFRLRDSAGAVHSDEETRRAKASVFVFLSPACPMSNRAIPELVRLYVALAGQGVLFFGVYSDPSFSAPSLRSHESEFPLPFPRLLDSGQLLARGLRATTTPQAFVVSSAGEMLYSGRIDNRVASVSERRPAASREDLRVAIEEVLAGAPVSQPELKAVGCAIPRPTAAKGGVTWAAQIAPILYKRCLSCHREGESAPFALASYEDARSRAAMIAAVTEARYMPPWKPVPGYGHFAGESRLRADEIAAIKAWAAAGAPSGELTRAPSPPQNGQMAQLGVPDLTVKMPRPFEVPAGGPDLYHCILVPLPLDKPKYVRAVAFRPGARRAVHHALLFLDGIGAARRAGLEKGQECFGAPGFLPTAGLGGWSPGNPPLEMGEGLSVPIQPGTDLVLQLHYHPSGKPESDVSSVDLYFTDQPPTRRVFDIALGSRQIDIPPGERRYLVRDDFTLPVPVTLTGVIPHAHFICRQMRGWAILPGGRREELIWIRDWDFNWQDRYRYVKPIALPEGTRLEMEFVYDNSNANPRNPNAPPRRVLWGPGTADEMAGLHLQVLAERREDEAELGAALWGKVMRSVGGGFYRRPERSPQPK